MERWRAIKVYLGDKTRQLVRRCVRGRTIHNNNATGMVSRKATPPSNDINEDEDADCSVIAGRGLGEGMEEEGALNRGGYDGPPLDDCCPICFGSFTVPCKAICGHWYCGSCILQYWNYSAASTPCKCPMCSSSITKLIPEASLLGPQEEEVAKVLENVNRYNLLYVGGARGLVQKVRQSPLFMKRIFQQMMDPDRPDYLHEMRLCAIILGVFYAASPFDFIPTGGLGIVRLFDYIAIVLVLILRLIGILQKRRLAQRVRHLAAAQPLGE